MKVIKVISFAFLIASFLLLLSCDAKSFDNSQVFDPLCRSRHETICINLEALDDSKFLAAVVNCTEMKKNEGRLTQKIQVKKCIKQETNDQSGAFGECSFPGPIIDSSKLGSKCVQKYKALNTSTIDENGVNIHYEKILIPAGCECQLFRK